MRKAKIKLTLQDDVVFSERAASQGAHACLEYVPGAALLGWTASRLYAQLSPADAWLVFHSGKVRFGDGFPLAGNGLQALPIPLCWHHEKESDWRQGGRILDGNVLNVCHDQADANKQLKQLRDGFVTEDGLLHSSAKSLTMKTAINPLTGRAAQAQLFGYEALQAGQVFTALLCADNDVSEDLFTQVKQACSGLMHLGRSRSAQYGRVLGEISEARQAVTETQIATRDVLFWLLSDMALERHGQPVMKPETMDMGLPDGDLITSKSFVRSRRYAPYNGKRRAPDLERQVISAGSILYFKMNEPVDTASLPFSYGLFRESGLGTVMINPPLLSSERPVFCVRVDVKKSIEVKRPSHPLVQWLLAQGNMSGASQEIRRHADILFEELANLYASASSSAARSVGPGKSQWGRVRELAMQKDSPQDLSDKLFGSSGVCKEKNNEDWTSMGQKKNGDFISFRDWLMVISKSEPEQDLPQILSLLAQQATKFVAQQQELT